MHLELQIDVAPSTFPTDWETLLHTAPNPKLPTLEEAMREALTVEETEQFSAHLRPLVETEQPIQHAALAYLWAVK
jgi:hypothetical protein